MTRSAIPHPALPAHAGPVRTSLAPLAAAGAAVALRRLSGSGWDGLALGTALTPGAVLALLAVFVLYAGDPGDPLHGGAGLLERALIAVALAWVAATGRRLQTAGRSPGEDGRAGRDGPYGGGGPHA